MFGALLRAAPQALFIALLAAITSRVLDPFLSFIAAGPAETDDLLYSGLESASENFLLVGLLALLVTLVARAVIEARVGGGV
jgi:hypothetical protein